MLDIERGYDGWVGWGEGMVPERRQEHVPYIYSYIYSYIYMYAIQTIETPITTSLLNRNRTPKRTQSTELHKIANPLKFQNSLGN